MDNQSIEKNLHPEEPNFLENNDFLSPAEHILLGSSVRVSVNNPLLDTREIIKEGPQFYLLPIVLNPNYKNRFTLEETEKARHNKCMQGFFPVFVLEKNMIEYEQRIWLPELQDGGKINPRFRIQIVKYDKSIGTYSEITDIKIVSKLRLDKDLENFFSLEEEIDEKTKERTGALILSLK